MMINLLAHSENPEKFPRKGNRSAAGSYLHKGVCRITDVKKTLQTFQSEEIPWLSLLRKGYMQKAFATVIREVSL
jgi:hypothetical protein